MNEMDCPVVRDLLELYAEGMVEEETKNAVSDHLKNCESCTAEYEKIKSNEGVPDFASDASKQVKPLKKLRFHMVLNLIGLPLWLPILLAAASIVLAIYICIVSVLISAWCVPLAFAATSVLSVVSAIGLFSSEIGVIMLFAGSFLACAGLAVLSFFGCFFITKWFIKLHVIAFKKIKHFILSKFRKEVD